MGDTSMPVTWVTLLGSPMSEPSNYGGGTLPWPEKKIVTLREEFVLRALEPGANLSELCREYRISRKTGYKWLNRFRDAGRLGLEDMSRRRHHSPIRTSGEIVMRILERKAEYPRWGPKKIQALLVRSLGGDNAPSIRTVARVLDRAGLVQRRRKVSTRGTVVDALCGRGDEGGRGFV